MLLGTNPGSIVAKGDPRTEHPISATQPGRSHPLSRLRRAAPLGWRRGRRELLLRPPWREHLRGPKVVRWVGRSPGDAPSGRRVHKARQMDQVRVCAGWPKASCIRRRCLATGVTCSGRHGQGVRIHPGQIFLQGGSSGGAIPGLVRLDPRRP